MVARAPVPVTLTVALDERLAEAVEVAAYYVVSESLTNIGKHAHARTAGVDVPAGSTACWWSKVVDDGIGGADTEKGTGLRGLADRVESLGGRLRIWSPRGAAPDEGGTAVRVAITEDSVLLREGLARLLSEAGFDVVAEAVATPTNFARCSKVACPMW